VGCDCRLVRVTIWEPSRSFQVRRYYLQRWPSQRSMKRVRAKIKARTGRARIGHDIRGVIADLNSILRGWGNYFRTGNASDKFVQMMTTSGFDSVA
jgi:RNA-directed DNA polymerase